MAFHLALKSRDVFLRECTWLRNINPPATAAAVPANPFAPLTPARSHRPNKNKKGLCQEFNPAKLELMTEISKRLG